MRERSHRLYQVDLTDRQFYLLVWLFVSLAWIPAYMGLFPGTFGYDVPIQVSQLFKLNEMTLSMHHPIAHTALVGLFLSLGKMFFGSYQVGYAIFTAFQFLLVTATIARILLVLRKHNVKTGFILVSLLWFAFNPILQALSMNGTKDILFATVFLNFLLDYWEIMESHIDRCKNKEVNSECANKKKYRLLIIYGILFCLFRNQGVYIVICLLIIEIFIRNKNKGLLLSLFVITVIVEIFNAFCVNVLNLQEGNKREMFSVPMQQVAYVAHLYFIGDESIVLSKDDIRDIDKLIPDRSVMVDFDLYSADKVKSVFDTDEFINNLPHYIGSYFSIGSKNLGAFFKELKYLCGPYFNPYDLQYSGLVTTWTFTTLNVCDIKHKPLFSLYGSYLNFAVAQPLFIFSSISMWAILILIVVLIIKKKIRKMIFVLPLILYILTMLLGPVALLRYLFPIMLITPIIVAKIILLVNEKVLCVNNI